MKDHITYPSLVFSELKAKIWDWWYGKEEVCINEPLQIANPIWLIEFRHKYAVWVIENAYLRFKYARMDKNERQRLNDMFKAYLEVNIRKYTK
jgi:hypothetical protein